jgi:hypothetical protein
LHKENNLDEKQILAKVRDTNANHNCEKFLIKDFSEGGNEDEIAREEVSKIAQRLNYPAEYWRRTNIHKVMDEKNITYSTYKDKNCQTCSYCSDKYNTLSFCDYHKIEIFADGNVCENYKGEVEENPEVIYSALIQEKPTSLSETISIQEINNECIVFDSKTMTKLLIIEPFLLRSIQFDSNLNSIIARYVDKKLQINIDSKKVTKKEL